MNCKLDYTIDNNPFGFKVPNEDSHYTVKIIFTMGKITYTFMIHNPLIAEVEEWETFTTAIKNNTNSSINFEDESGVIDISTVNGELSFTFSNCIDGSFHTELQCVPNSCAVQTFEQLTSIRKSCEYI